MANKKWQDSILDALPGKPSSYVFLGTWPNEETVKIMIGNKMQNAKVIAEFLDDDPELERKVVELSAINTRISIAKILAPWLGGKK